MVKSNLHTIAGLQIILNVCIKVPTQSTHPAHVLWTHLDVDRAIAALPGQSEAMVLSDEDVLGYPLHFDVMNVVWELNTVQQ